MKLEFRTATYIIDKPKKVLFIMQCSLFGTNVECEQLKKTTKK